MREMILCKLGEVVLKGLNRRSLHKIISRMGILLLIVRAY